MAPSHQISSSVLFRVQTLGIITVLLPLSGFISCVFLTFLLNFEDSTKTHCEVPNLLPSISAAIGSYQLQKVIWQLCIALHSSPRLLFAYLYNIFFNDRMQQTQFNKRLIRLCFVLNVTEIFALLGLSLVTSKAAFEVHKTCFGIFILCSSIYMCINLYLVGRSSTGSRYDSKSVQAKRRIVYTHFVCVVLLMYFYYRHNTYCEPYVYTVFCFLEYVLVVMNMVYHLTAYFDLRKWYLTAERNEKKIREDLDAI